MMMMACYFDINVREYLALELINMPLEGTSLLTLEEKSFIWRIDELTMEFSEVAIMPPNLLKCLFDLDYCY
ncbi:hypothetical protein L2E82_31396 [Cichorium intybus]|uniref:Uncharacterized protein n=1 Tax=Cichorium intybus TaxID=13427 RepID=A0ACB9D3E7_CICIN|nr:hypothetical protein L2E82_31396 [Cichorium intybus]